MPLSYTMAAADVRRREGRNVIYWESPGVPDYAGTLAPIPFTFLQNIRIFQINGSNVPQVTCASADPTVNNDAAHGFQCGDIWVNRVSGSIFILVDPSDGAAVWTDVTSVSTVTVTTAVVDPTVNDDASAGFTVGDIWVNTLTGSAFIVVDTTVGAASWPQFAPAATLTAIAPINVDKLAASVGVGLSAARNDHKHDVTTAAPSATGVATASAEGAATSLARSDHAHQSSTAPANVTKAAAAIGTSGQPARADHKHDVATAAPGATGVATAAAEGTSTSLARADHAHASNTAPVDVTKAAAAIGTSGEPARADHKHDASTAAPTVGVGGANAEGVATTLARSDHNHTLRTTTGPTDLSLGAIADGEALHRSGSAIVGVGVTPPLIPTRDVLTAQLVTASDVVLTSVLSFVPTSAASLSIYLNGVYQLEGAGRDYSLSGTAITWLAGTGTAVNMKPTDVLVAMYWR